MGIRESYDQSRNGAWVEKLNFFFVELVVYGIYLLTVLTIVIGHL